MTAKPTCGTCGKSNRYIVWPHECDDAFHDQPAQEDVCSTCGVVGVQEGHYHQPAAPPDLVKAAHRAISDLVSYHDPREDEAMETHAHAALDAAVEDAQQTALALADRQAAEMVKAYDPAFLNGPGKAMHRELIDYFTQSALAAERRQEARKP